jgi:hypothetical protein
MARAIDIPIARIIFGEPLDNVTSIGVYTVDARVQ